jgi:hypothetical protein
MILYNCKHEINENTVNVYVEIEVKGKKDFFKFKTFIFNKDISDLIHKDEKVLFNIVTEEQLTFFIPDEDYELIKEGKILVPCTIVDFTKSNFE